MSTVSRGAESHDAENGPGDISRDPVFADLSVEGLSPAMTDLFHALLLYKSVFAGPWFTRLGHAEDERTRGVYESITRETHEQAERAAELLRRWDASRDSGKMERVTADVLAKLLQDMIELKKSSTEVFLAAGMRAPDEELRQGFLELAKIDRRHADVLRERLRARSPRGGEPKPEAGTGPRVGPFAAGSVARQVQDAVEAVRSHGHEPSRLVMSDQCLRHLRDEGAVAPLQGDVFGLPVDVDFSWGGEAFAVTSRDRLSLAEIVTEMSGDAER